MRNKDRLIHLTNIQLWLTVLSISITLFFSYQAFRASIHTNLQQEFIDKPRFFIADVDARYKNSSVEVRFQLMNFGKTPVSIDNMELLAYDKAKAFFKYDYTLGPSDLIGDLVSQPEITLPKKVFERNQSIFCLKVYYYFLDKSKLIKYISFFRWSRMSNGRFTYNAVSPSDIKSFENQIELVAQSDPQIIDSTAVFITQ
ncbi:hypothetical protein [Mucilaginibacter glaciei]|uniref:Uncharacterized protein n=1 Tax=Mucilaginibacter glaciei TaxID=2772109 RepID=A0A926S0D6_9SPHI|nr:hypothetical protein [Mucilaginibacter glaciei]MBD1391617.1 hypothetical protein [Mucilaginibacter glaciei]